jgi:DNA-binding XRE family transcriptional regulator
MNQDRTADTGTTPPDSGAEQVSAGAAPAHRHVQAAEVRRLLRLARADADISQTQMAAEMDLRPHTLSGIETGRLPVSAQARLGMQRWFELRGFPIDALSIAMDRANGWVGIEHLSASQANLVSRLAINPPSPQMRAEIERILSAPRASSATQDGEFVPGGG